MNSAIDESKLGEAVKLLCEGLKILPFDAYPNQSGYYPLKRRRIVASVTLQVSAPMVFALDREGFVRYLQMELERAATTLQREANKTVMLYAGPGGEVLRWEGPDRMVVRLVAVEEYEVFTPPPMWSGTVVRYPEPPAAKQTDKTEERIESLTSVGKRIIGE
jgi:hypothetical protein